MLTMAFSLSKSIPKHIFASRTCKEKSSTLKRTLMSVVLTSLYGSSTKAVSSLSPTVVRERSDLERQRPDCTSGDSSIFGTFNPWSPRPSPTLAGSPGSSGCSSGLNSPFLGFMGQKHFLDRPSFSLGNRLNTPLALLYPPQVSKSICKGCHNFLHIKHFQDHINESTYSKILENQRAMGVINPEPTSMIPHSDTFQVSRPRMRICFDPETEIPRLQRWFAENNHPSRQQVTIKLLL